MNIILKEVTLQEAKDIIIKKHYIHRYPSATQVKYGIFNNDSLIGCILFGKGAGRNCYMEFPDTKPNELLELTRLYIDNVGIDFIESKVISIAIKLIKKQLPNIKYIFSYADENVGHVGTIYQASNFLYMGEYAFEQYVFIEGKRMHRRSVNAKYGTSSIPWLQKNIDSHCYKVYGKPKHKYCFPLDKISRKLIAHKIKPYKKLQSCD